VFDNKLFQEKEGTLVINSLSKLNLSYPQMRSISFFAIIALKIGNYKFHYKALLEESTVEHFLLNSKFDLNASRMRFGPHETSIHKLHSLKSFYLL
jgi:hypothetical protein